MESTSVALPDWLIERRRAQDCDHDFSVERDVDVDGIPPYARGAAKERFCRLCGEKESLRHRIASSAPVAVTAPPPPAPSRRKRQPLPDPIPLEQISVTLDVAKYGQRYTKDRKQGVVDRAINVGPDPLLNDAMAAAAEEYVAKALGLPFAGAIDKPDRGWDMSFGGRRVQVKWTQYEHGKLIASPMQTNTADYYVLVTGSTTDEFTIAGWATAKELKSSTTDLGYGITYALGQERLRPFDGLLAIRLSLG